MELFHPMKITGFKVAHLVDSYFQRHFFGGDFFFRKNPIGTLGGNDLKPVLRTKPLLEMVIFQLVMLLGGGNSNMFCFHPYLVK